MIWIYLFIDIINDDFNDFFVYSVQIIQSNIHKFIFPSESFLNNLRLTDDLFKWKTVIYEELYNVVMKLSNSKSQDYYAFSNFLLKNIIHVVIYPLWIVINQYMD